MTSQERFDSLNSNANPTGDRDEQALIIVKKGFRAYEIAAQNGEAEVPIQPSVNKPTTPQPPSE